MNRCPITYELCGNQRYSIKGLHLLSPKLKDLSNFPFGKEEQLELALEYADKMSFSGVQRKLNARLSISRQSFEVVAKGGHFILKPQSPDYSELPENEDLTMKLASCAGIDTPSHGLMYCQDGSLSYFIKRFDRKGKGGRIGVEDFAQLAGVSPETKYDFSMEKIIPLIEKFCTFPLLEKKKFFLLTLFSFLIGNEDLHLKNFSLINLEGVTEFSPAYDLVNSYIMIKTSEELALPLRGKKSNLTRTDLVVYFGKERLNLPAAMIDEVLDRLQKSTIPWKELIQISFLSERKKTAYLNLLDERKERLFRANF
jgi:serine/threonine-protein kinase HipA